MISQIFTLVLLVIALSGAAQAAVVGRFTQAEGQVDILKGGKPPAVPVKINDGVEPGDAIFTKDLSRAQVQLLDDSILNVAPNSQIVIEQYLYEAAKNQRQASIQVLQGLVNIVVTRLFQVAKPDFIVTTTDAVLGVRGTECYVLKGADSDFTDAFTKTGRVSFKTAGAVLGGRGTEWPTLGGASTNLAHGFTQINKIAYTSPRAATVAQRGGEVRLGPMQTSRIIHNQSPMPVMNFTSADLQLLDRASQVGLPLRIPLSTNPRNLLQQIKPFIERQENLMRTSKGDLARKINAALAKGENLAPVMKDLMDKGEKIGDIMTAALAAGVKDNVEIANAAMAAGADLKDVKATLASMGYAGADTYTYTPPAPPAAPPVSGPSFPGGGGGGGGGSGGGGGVASPSS
jgi:hypothetical protein